MKKLLIFLMTVCGLFAPGGFAHPGSGIVVDAQGVLLADINRGLLKFGADGKVTVVLKEAGHWLAPDAAGKFTRMEFEKSVHWPRWFKHRSPPGEALALISDGGSPLVIHHDGNRYYVCNDERTVIGGLQIERLSPDGKLALVTPPRMKARVDELGRIKGLASGPDDALYATCLGAVLKVKLDGTFTTLKQPVLVPDCDRFLPPNTPAAHEPFLTGVAVNSRGDIYLAATGCRCVLKLNSDGQLSTVLKAEPPWAPAGLAFRGEDLYVAEWTNAHSDAHDYRPRVRRLGRDGRGSRRWRRSRSRHRRHLPDPSRVSLAVTRSGRP